MCAALLNLDDDLGVVKNVSAADVDLNDAGDRSGAGRRLPRDTATIARLKEIAHRTKDYAGRQRLRRRRVRNLVVLAGADQDTHFAQHRGYLLPLTVFHEERGMESAAGPEIRSIAACQAILVRRQPPRVEHRDAHIVFDNRITDGPYVGTVRRLRPGALRSDQHTQTADGQPISRLSHRSGRRKCNAAASTPHCTSWRGLVPPRLD